MYPPFFFPQPPFAQFPGGIDLGTVMVLPTGANIIYLRSGGPQTYDSPSLTGRIVQTLSAALSQCRSGLSDTVLVLPGHSESVTDSTMLTNLVNGTKIIGFGTGSNMPVFRWTATGGAWNITKSDIVIHGLRLRLEGANGITKAINITGADCRVSGCDIEVASGAALKATIAMEIGSGADRTAVIGNVWRGTATHNVTDGIKIVSTPAQVRITDNEMVFSATAANGCIRVSAAATGLKILRNVCYNTMTASTASIRVDAVAADGVIADNYAGILTDGVASATGIDVSAGTSLVKCFQNFTSDEPRRSGALSPAVVAT